MRIAVSGRSILLAAPAILLLAAAPFEEGYGLVRQLMSKQDGERREAARKLLQGRDMSLVPALVDALFFTPKLARAELLATLRGLTGENAGTGYYDWVELVGRRTDLAAGPGYLEWKLSLLSRIDPAYRKVFYPDAPVRIRLEEIVWGGVRLDGIPALEDPPRVAASEAGFLTGNELVFGVSAGCAHRAYPLRYLSWHEMVNDVIGGEPVTLSYCTLCDSGIAYSGRTPEGERRTFGTSGLLYRSNKLMFDRQTYTLWSNLTGEPVVGRLARSPVRLDVLPATVTTWEDWRAAHPDTTVLKLDASFGRRWNYTYTPGAADRARAGVSFPVWLKSKALAPKAEVYALRLGSHAKAYPVERVLRAGVVNDRVGGVDLVLIGDAKSGAVRAYRRDGRTFSPMREDRELRDESGTVWRITEEALLPQSDGAPRLDRVPGHLSFWFAWYGFFPQTEIYGLDADPPAAEPMAREAKPEGKGLLYAQQGCPTRLSASRRNVMPTRRSRYSAEETARRGDALYEREIRGKVETTNRGKVVAIDIDRGDYVIADNALAASERLLAQRPDAEIWCVRVGSRVLHRIGGLPSREHA